MKKLQKVEWTELNHYIDNNLIVANKHPEYDIWILNYSPKAQLKDFWDEYTLSCRGLVIDANGNILARPFQKFKNFEEYDVSEIDMSQDYDVFEKMDGSLIILFYYEPQMKWIFASRGSFISEQVLEAQKMIVANVFDKLNKNCTYLFEIIYPENHIIVNYGNKRELILLTVIETKSGFELYYDDLVNKYSKYFTIVKRYKIKNIDNIAELKKFEEENREGFVVRFFNGFRVKIKFAEYIRLDGILTNVSNLTIWEHLMNKYDFNILLDRVPDEFYGWLKKVIASLELSYNDVERKALKEFVRIYYINDITDRKLFAMEAVKSEFRPILFKLYNKKSYDEIIWKQIKPKFSKPFHDKYEYSI